MRVPTSSRVGLAVLGTLSVANAWLCIPIKETTLHAGVVWKQQNCTEDPDLHPPLVIVNSLHVDLAEPTVRLVPLSAEDASGQPNTLATLPGIAQQPNQLPGLLGGINGGYFWRIDVDGLWVDDVCFGKTRADAMTPASIENPNWGVGDGAVITDGKLQSNNCDCKGFSRPATFSAAGGASAIAVGDRGESIDPAVFKNAISAGPNVVSFNATTGSSFIDIPEGDDNVNRLVYEAGTAAGLVHTVTAGNLGTATHALLVTVDGTDGCSIFKAEDRGRCGISTRGLGSLMLEVFNATQAMSMDQGGSTTMWIAGQALDNDGIVSRTCEKSECGARSIANGLFIQALD